MKVNRRQTVDVEDAACYLRQVKFKFRKNLKVYNDFLRIFLDFRHERIDGNEVRRRVINLFQGHPDLVVGLNRFLPPCYRISVQRIQEDPPNGEVRVSIPLATVGRAESNGPTVIILAGGPPLHANHSNSASSHSLAGKAVKAD